MVSKISDTTKLANGVRMPWLGLGVWQAADGAETLGAVRAAIKAGYRGIDTAAAYENEASVGRGIAESGVDRRELFITTKVWNSDQGYASTLKAFEESRKKLLLAYIDLYLIHWPVKGKYKDTWRALERLYADGNVRAIGVSNFQASHLEDLMASCKVVPAVNQVEFHPRLTQKPLRAFCREQGIQLEAWSPLLQGHLDQPELKALAAKHSKTPAQIVLRWDLQHEVVTIPKSVHESRIVENANVFDFQLSDGDMAAIDRMNSDHRYGADPDNFNF